MRKIFCVGLGKTGTSTFARCMHLLGYRHLTGPCLAGLTAYRLNDFTQLLALANDYESFDDFPWPYMYELLDAELPNSKFVLTTRTTADVWFRSLCSHHLRKGTSEAQYLAYGCYRPHHNEYKLKGLYTEHNHKVREHFRGTGRLIEVCWENGDSWKELCDFIGAALPDRRFPHINASSDDDPKTIIKRLCIQHRYATAIDYAKSIPDSEQTLSKSILNYINIKLKYTGSKFAKSKRLIRYILSNIAEQSAQILYLFRRR